MIFFLSSTLCMWIFFLKKISINREWHLLLNILGWIECNFEFQKEKFLQLGWSDSCTRSFYFIFFFLKIENINIYHHISCTLVIYYTIFLCVTNTRDICVCLVRYMNDVACHIDKFILLGAFIHFVSRILYISIPL